MPTPEVAQTVIVHAHAAAKPLIRNVTLAQLRKAARRTHPLQSREKPQRQQNRRVRSRTTRPIRARTHLCVETAQVQTFHETPNHTSPMVRRKQPVQIDHPPFHPIAVRTQTPRPGTIRHRNPLRLTSKTIESQRHPARCQFLHTLESGNDEVLWAGYCLSLRRLFGGPPLFVSGIQFLHTLGGGFLPSLSISSRAIAPRCRRSVLNGIGSSPAGAAAPGAAPISHGFRAQVQCGERGRRNAGFCGKSAGAP